MSLEADLRALFARGVEAPLDDDAFDALALRVFGHQFGESPVYARYCRGRGVTPDDAARWTDVPPVPTRAFKRLDLVCGDAADAEATFRTSGTSAGPERRGRHHVVDLGLYHASLLPNWEAHLHPDGIRTPMAALVPPPDAVPDSSLIHMIGVAMDRLALPGGGYFVDADGTLRTDELDRTLRELADRGEPVLVAGTAFSYVHWLDHLEERGIRHSLPSGSRLMETGGFKGRSREVAREDLYALLEERLGVPRDHIVNEYGMTEMLSQFWEPVLREALAGGPTRRRHRPPPWVRTRVLDPETLDPLPAGEPGILHHFDLANLHSAASILTEDLGVEVGDGFRILGRSGEAEPRGCSIAMDELLAATTEGR